MENVDSVSIVQMSWQIKDTPKWSSCWSKQMKEHIEDLSFGNVNCDVLVGALLTNVFSPQKNTLMSPNFCWRPYIASQSDFFFLI